MRVLYKLLVLTYRALEGKGPSYLQDIIELYKPKTSVVLHSNGRLDLPWSNLVSYGDRAFSVAAPANGIVYQQTLKTAHRIICLNLSLRHTSLNVTTIS